MNRYLAALACGPQYQAALHLLTNSPVFQDQAPDWVAEYLPLTGGIDFPRLLGESRWSTGERYVIEAAASIFGCRPVDDEVVRLNLLDLRTSLDAEHRRILYEAMEMAM
jgi:hypothetical protein